MCVCLSTLHYLACLPLFTSGVQQSATSAAVNPGEKLLQPAELINPPIKAKKHHLEENLTDGFIIFLP